MFSNTFYRNYKYSADDNILVLIDKKPINEKAKPFIVNLINKKINTKFSYGKQYRIESFNQTKIQLPTKNGEIDFEFMENFITELEINKFKEVEQYLIQNNLINYHLTEHEIKVLQDFESEKFEWKDFKIGDLFEIGTGSLLSSTDSKIGIIPRISAKSENNGILGCFETENIAGIRHFENFISVNFFGTDGGIFYHPYKASVEMKVHTLKIPNTEFNSQVANFLVSALKMSLTGFGYGNQLSSSKLKDEDFKIQLPRKDGQIDYELMETFISAIQKLVIKDVVKYIEQKI